MLKRKMFIPAIWIVVYLFLALPAFAQDVDTAWVRRYNGPGGPIDPHDFANAIAVDGFGNVYVTGYSRGSGTGEDYATIKYLPNGDTAWVRRYNGSRNDQDRAHAIDLDDSGNVYVTGYCDGHNFMDGDYATIKYYSNGDTAWVRRYDGPANLEDWSYALAVDCYGSVYVTGYSIGNGTSHDYATIKYCPNGDTAWVRRYNGPGNSQDRAYAITIDSSGNVYVTGDSWGIGTYKDCATIKYYSNGDTAWVRRYNNSPRNLYDGGRAIAIDISGNVYVTGSSSGSGTSEDYLTIKYYSNGDTAWVRRYNGPGWEDWARGIAVDDSGNVFVTGESYNGTDVDIATIRYYPNGDPAWVRIYRGPGNSIDDVYSVAVDGSGDVYVTGKSAQDTTCAYIWDFTTIKYYSNGDTGWIMRYDGPRNYNDAGHAITVDDSKNVYVTGYSSGIGGADYATIKYVQFLRADVNGDTVVEVGDVVYLINYLYINGPPPVPILQVGDVNCDGVVDVGDILYLIAYLYKGGPAPSC